jgi:hypothetical protein
MLLIRFSESLKGAIKKNYRFLYQNQGGRGSVVFEELDFWNFSSFFLVRSKRGKPRVSPH